MWLHSHSSSCVQDAHISVEHAEKKPVEVVKDTEHLAKDDTDAVVAALEKLVDGGAKEKTDDDDHIAIHGVHAPFHDVWRMPSIHKLIPGLEDLANSYHFGNYVIVRETGEKIFESMPIYPR